MIIKKYISSLRNPSVAIYCCLCVFTSTSFADKQIQVSKELDCQKNIEAGITALENRVTKIEENMFQIMDSLKDTDKPIQPFSESDLDSSQFILLAIPIALIGYLGNIFIKIRETISSLKTEIEKRRIDIQDREDGQNKNETIILSLKNEISLIDRDIKRHSDNLLFLIIADVLLIILGLANILSILDKSLNISIISTSHLYPFIIGLLSITIIYLSVLHFFQWIQMFKIYNRERNHPVRTAGLVNRSK